MPASRLAHQIPDAEKAAQADYVLDNTGDMASLRTQVDDLWPRLKAESNNSPENVVFKIEQVSRSLLWNRSAAITVSDM